LSLCLISVFSINAQAGTYSLSKVQFDFKQIAVLSKGLERSLAARHARVAIIGRVGLQPDILPPGVRFSHAGLAVYSRIETRDGRLLPGYAVYNLYGSEQRTARSHLEQDYPVDYLVISQKLEVGVVIPTKKLQELLIKTIQSDVYTELHNPDYSVISNPYSLKYQNCTEFVLDVIFASIYNTSNRQVIKSYITAYFKPQILQVDELKLQLAALTVPELKTDDHNGPIATATFTSIARFLKENGIAEEAYVYSIEPATLYGKIEELQL